MRPQRGVQKGRTRPDRWAVRRRTYLRLIVPRCNQYCRGAKAFEQVNAACTFLHASDYKQARAIKEMSVRDRRTGKAARQSSLWHARGFSGIILHYCRESQLVDHVGSLLRVL